MREILFRGKRVDNGRWVEGQYTCEEYEPHLQKVLHIDRIAIAGACVSVGVIPETVGQYTGLKGKNGKKIFEGDILIYVVDGEYDVNEKYLVVFDDDEAAFKVRFYYKGKFRCYDDIAPCEKLEIIGNIHDNPELLEGA